MVTSTKGVIWDSAKRGSHVLFDINHRNSHFIPLNFVPQDGPQCGFAALSMIASSAGLRLCPNELVKRAKLKKITNHGEMFSARDMSYFARELLSEYFDVTLKCHSIKGLSYQFKEYFENNNLILIPYDCDFNNEPCLKNGTKAHWAALCGYVDGGEDNFFVLACHGKSQYVSAWSFSDLQLSNDNLTDLGTKRTLDKNFYLIPAGGLKEGIASKWILFEKKSL